MHNQYKLALLTYSFTTVGTNQYACFEIVIHSFDAKLQQLAVSISIPNDNLGYNHANDESQIPHLHMILKQPAMAFQLIQHRAKEFRYTSRRASTNKCLERRRFIQMITLAMFKNVQSGKMQPWLSSLDELTDI